MSKLRNHGIEVTDLQYHVFFFKELISDSSRSPRRTQKNKALFVRKKPSQNGVH